jgi:tetratricopeptide (TPR) repeat protein
MRYVPVARRRIELFIDFLRAWFSLEERKRLFQERWERFHACQSRGLVGMAGQCLRDAEYYAASLDDPTERKSEMERVADAYIALGDWPSAAGLFAELAGSVVRSKAKFESLGYSVLAGRLMDKGDVERALKGYSEALVKDRKNPQISANFGTCLLLSGRHAQAKEQFDRVLKSPRLNGATRSMILTNRGVARLRLGDQQGGINDFSAASELPGAPAETVAGALINRGSTKGQLGDSQGAMADYTALIKLKGATAEQVAIALLFRGISKSQQGDSMGAMADYTTLVDLKGAPTEQVARALVNRGIAKGKQGDLKDAIADFTAVIELKDATAEQLARALANRGIAEGRQGNPQGAVADYTALVELKGAPAESVAEALTRRGVIHHNSGQYEGALRDFNLSLEITGLPRDSRIHTIFHRGEAHEEMGKPEEALADYAQCAQSSIMPFVHYGLQSTVRLLLSGKRVEEALAWVRRFHELEPRDASLDTGLEARLDMIRAASRIASLDDASRLVDALLEADPEELRARLQFLKPGLELAKTNDESVLANLPEDERKIAREIARSLGEAARPPMGQPLS